MIPRAIGWTATLVAGAVALAAEMTAAPVPSQDRPKPQVLALANPMSPAEAAARLTGHWKLNEELTPPIPGSSSSLPGNSQGSQSSGGRRGGANGRPLAFEAMRLQEERNIRMRALYREMAEAPATLALKLSVNAASFTDAYGVERKVTINGKKEKLDLGTARVESRSRWNGTALTIELDGGPDLKVTEIFELSPTGTQMLVTIRAGEERAANARGLRGSVQRVYDRTGAGSERR